MEKKRVVNNLSVHDRLLKPPPFFTAVNVIINVTIAMQVG